MGSRTLDLFRFTTSRVGSPPNTAGLNTGVFAHWEEAVDSVSAGGCIYSTSGQWRGVREVGVGMEESGREGISSRARDGWDLAGSMAFLLVTSRGFYFTP